MDRFEVEDSSRTKEKGPIVKTDSSSTTEGSKERSCEPNTEKEEKMVLRELAQDLERMFIKQNECITTFREEHNSMSLKRRRTLGNDEA